MTLFEVQENPNCRASSFLSFEALGPSKEIIKIRCEKEGNTFWAEVIGVQENGLFVPACAQKVADSGDGFAFLIRGGAWGIRLRNEKENEPAEPWDLSSPRQWGEPYLIYGDEADFVSV